MNLNRRFRPAPPPAATGRSRSGPPSAPGGRRGVAARPGLRRGRRRGRDPSLERAAQESGDPAGYRCRTAVPLALTISIPPRSPTVS